ncbi:MAG TPA: aromatic acid/H+ symport family MFS transporter [Bryobacteraceae bacterium]|nr:aromatic acid/H+ symport family MFS transporter [Bryobacteraceae bacterium]
MDQRIISFRAALDARPITGFQIRIVIIAVLLLLTEGFDSQAIGYVAPPLRALLHLSALQMGSALSVGLFGLTIGALLFAPLADRFNTRGLLVICILICGISTLATVWVSSLRMLIVLRFLTGFGVGGVMPQAVGVVSEFAPTRKRATILTIAMAGFSLGGVVGGTISAALMPTYGWQSVLVFGGVAALLMLPLVVWSFPNSLPQLLNSAEPRAELAKVVALLTPGWKEPKAEEDAAQKRFPVNLLFTGGYAGRTLLIWVAYFMNIMALYFILNWLPSVLKAGGLSLAHASVITSLYSAGGIVGGLLLSYLSDKTKPQWMLGIAFVLSAVCLFGLGSAGANAVLLTASTIGAGFCTIGGQNSMNAFTSAYYPSAARATGLGWALGVGRCGSILGPYLGGVLLQAGVSGPNLLKLVAVPAVITAIAILLVSKSPEAGALDVAMRGSLEKSFHA